jgi:hypothetical protein
MVGRMLWGLVKMTGALYVAALAFCAAFAWREPAALEGLLWLLIAPWAVVVELAALVFVGPVGFGLATGIVVFSLSRVFSGCRP